MDPYYSWAVLLALAGAIAFYYSKDALKSVATGTAEKSSDKLEKPVDSKKKKEKKDKKKKEKDVKKEDTKKEKEVEKKVEKKEVSKDTKKKTVPAAAAANVGDDSSDDNEDIISNAELARQLSAARQGTALSSSKEAKKGDTKKNKKNNNSKKTLPMATTPATASTPSVADMLEQPAAGPSVIRLTGDLSDSPKSKSKKNGAAKQPPQPAETKKQAQRRAKAAANRELVEEAERQRRALMEKQMHLARESERKEDARRGNPVKAAGVNVWSQPAKKAQETASSKTRETLLDTFDSAAELPSEEEQMRILMNKKDDADEWTTVGKKKVAASSNSTDNTASSTPSVDVAPLPAPAAAAPVAAATVDKLPAVKPSKMKTGTSGIGLGGGIPDFSKVYGDIGSHPLDSDWVA